LQVKKGNLLDLKRIILRLWTDVVVGIIRNKPEVTKPVAAILSARGYRSENSEISFAFIDTDLKLMGSDQFKDGRLRDYDRLHRDNEKTKNYDDCFHVFASLFKIDVGSRIYYN